MNNKYKIKPRLFKNKGPDYARDVIDLPEHGMDCYEGYNPYSFPPECLTALKNFDPERLGQYPHSTSFYDAIIDYWSELSGINLRNIFITDGSINALYCIINIFDFQNTVVLGMAPQFSGFYAYAEMMGIDYDLYGLKQDNNFRFDVDEFFTKAFLSNRSYDIIYIDNPNNPTGQCISIDDIEKIIKEANIHDIAVIIDEAYGDYMPKNNSAIQLCDKYQNLIVVRSVSKGFGLAGIRAGYIIASGELIQYIKDMANPYMVGELSRVLAAEALKHDDYLKVCMTDFAGMKKEIETVLASCDDKEKACRGGLHMAETLDTNVLLTLYHDDRNIDLMREFYKRGILVVDGCSFRGLEKNAVRLSLPKKENFSRLLNAIKDISTLLNVRTRE